MNDKQCQVAHFGCDRPATKLIRETWANNLDSSRKTLVYLMQKWLNWKNTRKHRHSGAPSHAGNEALAEICYRLSSGGNRDTVTWQTFAAFKEKHLVCRRFLWNQKNEDGKCCFISHLTEQPAAQFYRWYFPLTESSQWHHICCSSS